MLCESSRHKNIDYIVDEDVNWRCWHTTVVDAKSEVTRDPSQNDKKSAVMVALEAAEVEYYKSHDFALAIIMTTTLTPFSHYLQSNQGPSEDEICEIKALRTKPLQEISIIDVEIERTECILNSLKRKRIHIQKSVDDFNTILAPVRRLSMDVLGVIFSHCLVTHRNPVMSPTEAPILLTQVCRDWRSIALSIPRLWSRLHIPFSHKEIGRAHV